MDWGLITVVLAITFLGAHLFMDFRSLTVRLRRPHTKDGGRDDGYSCEQCHARLRGERELRHEAIWTIAAVAVLTGHIILDFVQRGG